MLEFRLHQTRPTQAHPVAGEPKPIDHRPEKVRRGIRPEGMEDRGLYGGEGVLSNLYLPCTIAATLPITWSKTHPLPKHAMHITALPTGPNFAFPAGCAAIPEV